MESTISDLFTIPSMPHVGAITIRLLAAVILGGIVGFDRQRKGKAAGLRTHMLVALGTALFTIVPMEAGMAVVDLSRVLQGIAAGIGFIGAGAILKLTDQEEIKGLTTAASIWFTAALGVASALGSLWLPFVAVFLGVIILSALRYLERAMESD
jgi:putative Mg2+ transporter-C (MgtC) family protein